MKKHYLSYGIHFISVVLFLSGCILLYSCGKMRTLKGEPVNNYGGCGKTNSYERFGKFYTYSLFTDVIDKSMPGAAIIPLALSATEAIIATSDAKIMRIYDNKTIKWSASLGDSSVPAAGMCADPEQNVYIIDNMGMIYSFSGEGAFRWKIKMLDTLTGINVFSDLTAVKDGIIAAVSSGKLAKYSFEGKLIWERRFGANTSCYAASDEGSIVLSLTNNTFGASDTLALIKSDGSTAWKLPLEGTRLLKNPVVFGDRIYIAAAKGSGDDKLYEILTIALDGRLINEIEVNLFPRFLSVDIEGNLYCIAYNSGIGETLSGIFCFIQDGKLLWKNYFDAVINSPLLLGKKYLAFSGFKKNDPIFVFLKKDGNIEKNISLNNLPVLLMKPFVTPEGVICFAGSDILCIVRIDENWINKILPW